MRTVLILGGTTEAAELARRLASRDDSRVISSLAGRTREPGPLPGEVRVGGFGGVAGMVAYLRAEGVDVMIVATHPFATRIARDAVEACRAIGIPRLVVIRPAWERPEGETWIEVDDATAATEALPANARAFLTVGRQGVATFAPRRDVWFLIRVVDPPDPPFSGPHEIILARGPFSIEGERELMIRHRIDVLVTKNAGGSRAKLDAARELGLPVVMIRRPRLPESGVAVDVETVVGRLDDGSIFRSTPPGP